MYAWQAAKPYLFIFVLYEVLRVIGLRGTEPESSFKDFILTVVKVLSGEFNSQYLITIWIDYAYVYFATATGSDPESIMLIYCVRKSHFANKDLDNFK